MDVENVARAVLYMDSLPLDANLPFLYAWELASGSLGRTYSTNGDGATGSVVGGQ